MKYEVTYKSNENGIFSILVNEMSYATPLIFERGVENLCKKIQTFINKFSGYNNYKVEVNLSSEEYPLGLIIDLYKDSDDEPFGSANYMFDDYNY